MIKLFKKLTKSLKDSKGMELIQIMGLMAVALVLAGVLMLSAQGEIGTRMENVGENIASIYDFVKAPEEGEKEDPSIQTVLTAFDSERLGGQLPDYYGKATDSISTYTHLKSGTVHNLTGSGDNIKFLTTADWEANDTLTINGKEARIYDLLGERIEGTALFKTGVIVNMFINYIESEDAYNCYLKLGGGGDSELNFEVVGSPTVPSSAVENTIWVKTSTEIGEYQLSTTQPTKRADSTALQNGDVWIAIANNGTININAVKENGVIFYIANAKQYIDGEWVTVSIKVYQNGEWKSCMLYLYEEGNECKDITGGWTGKRMGEGASNTSQSKGTNYLYLQVNSSNLNSIVLYFTSNKIDLTGYSKLCAKALVKSSGNYGTFAVGVASSQGEGIWDGTWVKGASSPAQTNYDGTVELDISNLSDKYYIALRSFKYSAWTGAYNNATIYQVWLE